MTEATLESLRQAGHDRLDPVYFHYLQTMAARLPGQPPAVQRVLAQRLQAALAAYTGRAHAAADLRAGAGTGQAAPLPDKGTPLKGLSPLAQLNRDLQARSRGEQGAEPGEGDEGADATPLKSAQAFAEVWAKVSAEQQLAQALHRGPENAGPLNPHRLMLRTLRLMRRLSPDYVRRFMAQADALLWLDQAQPRPRPRRATAKPARAPRAKPGRG